MKRLLFGILVPVLTAVASAPAAAQNAQAELGVGYQYVDFGDQSNFPIGFNVDFTWPLDLSGLALAAEVGWSRASEDIGELHVTENLLNVGGGIRWKPAVPASVAPYVQVLIGAERYGYADDFAETSSWDLMWQPGAGVDVPLNDAWSVFGQFELRQVVFDGESDSAFRLVAGARLGL